MTSMALTKNNSSQLSIVDIEDIKKMAEALLKTGHYQKLGSAGIFAVIQMARSLGIDEIMALNGGLYPIDGKIEMEGKLMMALIRKAGHSVTKDSKSTKTECILHGKRADTGDTWSESFGVDDAKMAGLLSRGVYQKYGPAMFQWRALSRLAHFLFPDVIKGCYVSGEISEAPKLNAPVDLELEESIALQIKNQNPEEEIILNLPDNVNMDRVNIFIEEISNQRKKTIYEIKKGASTRMDSFLDKFKEWEQANYPNEETLHDAEILEVKVG